MSTLPVIDKIQSRTGGVLRRASQGYEYAGLPLLAQWFSHKFRRRILRSLRRADDKEQELACVALRRGKVPFFFRTHSSDLDVAGQIFFNREYGVLDNLNPPGLIVDAGANIGAASMYFLLQFPDARCICIEPDSRNVAVLRRNLAMFADRVKVFHGALWGHPADLKVVIGEYRDGGEWATTVRECLPGEQSDVRGYSLPELLEVAGEAHVDLLKIDIERGELALFGDNPDAWLNRTSNLVIELHDDQCRMVFEHAMGRYEFTRSECGENVVTLGIQAKRAMGLPRIEQSS